MKFWIPAGNQKDKKKCKDSDIVELKITNFNNKYGLAINQNHAKSLPSQRSASS
jgi:glycine betaine/choline ABC-type transport system substrate-binding protein